MCHLRAGGPAAQADEYFSGGQMGLPNGNSTLQHRLEHRTTEGAHIDVNDTTPIEERPNIADETVPTLLRPEAPPKNSAVPWVEHCFG